MRITALRTQNIAGLADGETVLPDYPVIALAGANGSGKSRFLRALLVPWTFQPPTVADQSQGGRVEVDLEFSEAEQALQRAYSLETQQYESSAPVITVIVEQRPLSGVSNAVSPSNLHWIGGLLRNPDLLRRYPSLDLVYMPAERRLTPGQNPFTLVSISPEDNARAAAQLREAYGPGGVLEDYEFEDYARTLCIAAYLPDQNGEIDGSARATWDRFLEGVNGVLAPKQLLPLTQETPGALRVLLPSGEIHELEGLSSGERQALILISRIFRAGEGHSNALIDEPDAYLHPSLSAKLMAALRLGLGSASTLIVATHSPSILDSLDAAAILRFEHGLLPHPLNDEVERLDLYRDAGFRASALSQSDFLVMTEGDLDGLVLQDQIPEMNSAAFRTAGGRDLVFRNVAALHNFDLPILGVVDADVLAAAPNSDISGNIFVWSRADVEGVLLSSPEFVKVAFESRLFNADVTSPAEAEERLRLLAVSLKDSTINEYAVRLLRAASGTEWPSSGHSDLRNALIAVGGHLSGAVTEPQIDAAFERAEAAWVECDSNPFTLVRGKRVLRLAQSEGLIVTSSTDAFVRATLAKAPLLPQIEPLRELARSLTDRARSSAAERRPPTAATPPTPIPPSFPPSG